MRRALLIFVLILSCVASGQQVPQPETDMEWDTELNLFNRFYGSGDTQGPLEHAQRMMEIATRKKLNPRALGASEWAMGAALFSLQKFQQAESHMRESLRLRESVLPANHYRVLQSLALLGRILYFEKKYDEATPVFERAIAGLSAIPDRNGVQECEYGMAMTELGYISMHRQNYDKAEGLLVHASRSFLQAGPGCGQMHGVFAHLSDLYWIEDKKDKAEEVLKLAVRELTPDDGDAPDYHYGYYMGRMAALYRSEHRLQEAEALYKKVLDMALHVNPVEGRGMGTVLLQGMLREYRDLLLDMNRKDEAAAVEQRLNAIRRINTENTSDPNMQFQNLMDEFRKAQQERRFDDAENILGKALAAAPLLGRDRRVLDAEGDLAYLLDYRGRHEQALNTMQGMFARAEREFANEPQVLGMACDSLANLYTAQQNESVLEDHLKHCLAIWEKYPNRADSFYASSLSRLAGFYTSHKQWAMAEPYLLRALETQEKVRAADDPFLVPDLQQLGYLYSHMGKWETAKIYYRRVLAINEKRFGTNSPQLSGELWSLAEAERNLGRPKDADELDARRAKLDVASSTKPK